MAKIRLLVDTDIIIDYLKGLKSAKEIFRANNLDVYCSISTKKELLFNIRVNSIEREKIIVLLNSIKVLKIDVDILKKYDLLVKEYGVNSNILLDYMISATAWSRKIPLLTKNKKHFKHIKEIKLLPVYDY